MERMLMEYLVNSIWQAPVVAGGAWMVLRAGRPGPRVQHGVWVAALALMVSMPLLSLRGVPVESAAAPALVAAEVEPAQPLAIDSAGPVASEDFAGVMDQQPSASFASPPSAIQASIAAKESMRWLRMREMRLGPLATRWLAGLYLALMGLAMMRLLWSWMVASRMVAEATPAVLSDSEDALLDACCVRLQVRRPRVLVSEKTSTPLVVGVLRPALLLPERFAECGDESTPGEAFRELEAVWLHELAHVRRRDYLANLMCRVWVLPVAYHPATYAVERRVRQTREMVCDRMAAEGMKSSVRYARCLVVLAQRMQNGRAMAEQMPGVGLFDGGILEERVVELIGKKVVESFRMRAARVGCGVAMLAAVLGGAATFHVTPTMAQALLPKVADGFVAPVAAVQTTDAANAEIGGSRAQGAPDSETTARRAVELPVAAQSKVGSHHGIMYKTWLDQDVVWIITPEEREEFLRLSNDEERDRFIANFWLRRDTPGAPADSYKEEHYRRLAYSNGHFAAGMPGWRTDRGRIYIVDGKPDSIDVVPGNVNGGLGAPAEVWHYRSLPGSGREATMRFVDVCGCGEYRLQASADLPVNAPFKVIAPGGAGVSNPIRLRMLSLPATGSKPQIVYTADGGSLRVFLPQMIETSVQATTQTPAEAQGAASPAPAAPAEPGTPAKAAPLLKHKTEAPQPAVRAEAPIAPKAALKPGMPTPKIRDGSGDSLHEVSKGERLQLSETLEELLRAQKEMQDAQSAFRTLDLPRYRKQFDEIQRQAQEAMGRLNTPEFRQRLADAQDEAAKLNDHAFRKQQLDKIQKQVQDAMEKMNSPEFKQNLAEAQKQAKEAADKASKSPEFQQKLVEAGRQAEEAMDKLNTAEFQHKFAEAQKNSTVRLDPQMLKQMPDGKWKIEMSPQAQKQIAEMRVARLKQQLDQAQKDLDRLNSGEGKKTEAPRQPAEKQ